MHNARNSEEFDICRYQNKAMHNIVEVF